MYTWKSQVDDEYNYNYICSERYKLQFRSSMLMLIIDIHIYDMNKIYLHLLQMVATKNS